MDKIGVFLNKYLNKSETFIYERIKNFKSFTPFVFSYKTDNLNTFPHPYIYSFNGNSFHKLMFKTFRYSPLFEKAAKQNNIKLLQTHFIPIALETIWFSKKLNIPQVNFFHGSDVKMYTTNKWQIRLLKNLISSTAASVVVSNKMKDMLTS